MKVNAESVKPGLKLSIQKTKIMASGPNTSWQINGGKLQTLFSWSQESLWMMIAAMKLKDIFFLKENL